MKIGSLLCPRIPLNSLGRMLLLALLGAVIAGAYGIAHDQVTFTISPEYFTKLKFEQFARFDPGLPNQRIFVGIIGFLATWWVGLIAGWLIARVSVQGKELCPSPRWFLRGVLLMLVIAIVFGIAGYFLERRTNLLEAELASERELLRLENLKAFATVASIHDYSYLGGACGCLLALVMVRRAVRGSDPQ